MIVTEKICPPVLTLSEVVDRYLAIRQVEKKKYFAKYMIVAAKIWQEIFQKTIWVQKAVWKELKAGEPYSYIDIPTDCARLFSVSTTDSCGNLQPLFYNSQLNVIPKPTVRKCSCETCDCNVCEDIENMTLTTRELFTINGIIYYEKTWLKYCKNGNIIEYKEVPTKKFNDLIGDGGDFSDDFNNDFDIGSNALANFEIVTQTFQRTLCVLEVRPCGCPVDNDTNECTIQEFCGCLLPLFCTRKVKHRNQFFQNVNNNNYGEIKISECGNKIYFNPSLGWRAATKTQNPDFLQIQYQTNGTKPNQESQVPEYAEMCLFKGIDYLSKAFNNTYSLGEKQAAKWEYIHEQNEVIKFLNPLKLSDLQKIQNTVIRW